MTGIIAEYLVTDQCHGSETIVEQAKNQGIQARILLRQNRKEQRDYDKYLYRRRHLVENAFLHINQWRGIATRFAKNLLSFLAAAWIRCLASGFASRDDTSRKGLVKIFN